MKRTEVTYGQLDKVLRSLGFSCQLVKTDPPARRYEHKETGALILIPPFPLTDLVLEHHLVGARTTLDLFGIADPKRESKGNQRGHSGFLWMETQNILFDTASVVVCGPRETTSPGRADRTPRRCWGPRSPCRAAGLPWLISIGHDGCRLAQDRYRGPGYRSFFFHEPGALASGGSPLAYARGSVRFFAH
jgi:hypothetical protein